VRNMMSFIALFLAQNAGHRRQLAREPALIPAAIEEMLALGVGGQHEPFGRARC